MVDTKVKAGKAKEQQSLPGAGAEKKPVIQLADVEIGTLEILRRKHEDIGQLSMTAKMQMFTLFDTYRNFHGIRQADIHGIKDEKEIKKHMEEQDKRVKERAVDRWNEAAMSMRTHLKSLRGEIDETLRIIGE